MRIPLCYRLVSIIYCPGFRFEMNLQVVICNLTIVLLELCERLSRGRHLRFQSATFQPISTPRWARSAHELASP